MVTLSGECVFSLLGRKALLEVGDSLLSPCSHPAPDTELHGHVSGQSQLAAGNGLTHCPAPWRVAVGWSQHVCPVTVLPGDAGGAPWDVTPAVYHVPALGTLLVLFLLPERVLLTPALLSRSH